MQPIIIGNIVQNKDSCIYATFQYAGEGELYVLNRLADTQIPDASNIVNEGVYLGRYY